MKHVLHLSIGKVCTEVVSFCWFEIWVKRLSINFMNYLPIGFFMYLTTEKQCSRPLRLLGNAYIPLRLEKGHVPMYANENEW